MPHSSADTQTAHKVDEADLATFTQLLGYGPLDNGMLASDLSLRRKAGKILGQILIKLRKANPNLTFQFWTLTQDRGNTSDRQPVIDRKGMQSLADQMFRKLELSSFSVLELQGIGNHPRKGDGRTIMTHLHAMSWTDQPFDHKAVMKSLNEGTVWQNSLESGRGLG